MAVTDSVKAQIITINAEEKKSTTTFPNVNPDAEDSAVAECLDLYAGLMADPLVEMRVVETRTVIK